jgi:hypothetical protein
VTAEFIRRTTQAGPPLPGEGVSVAINLSFGEQPRPSRGVIPGMSGSVLHRTCIELYRSHAEDDRGNCRRCQVPRCPTRSFAARAIEAAGDDPRRYDAAADLPDHDVLTGERIGYRLGGVGRPKTPYYAWDR